MSLRLSLGVYMLTVSVRDENGTGVNSFWHESFWYNLFSSIM